MSAAAATAHTGANGAGETLLEVNNLVMHFPLTKGIIFQRKVGAVQAVDGVSFSVKRGETLGLVGESGCGKSTTGRAILQLYKPTAGEVNFHPKDQQKKDLTKLDGGEMRRMRRYLQMIFQDPYASLNPRMTVGNIIAEPMQIHNLVAKNERNERVQELLQTVGLNPYFANRYPHEFSGGQRQRIGVARALAANPEFIVADEPVSALDVSIQAQIVNLMEDLQEQFGLTYLFIAHDLSVVRHISDRVAVMYLGKVVELADRDELYENPLHPYTKALLSAVPIPDPVVEKKRERIILTGDVPSPINPPSGCHFHTRCPYVMDICKAEEPPFADQGAGHFVACHLYPSSGGGATNGHQAASAVGGMREARVATAAAVAELPPGAIRADGNVCPPTHPVKGNSARGGELIYHTPGSRRYDRTNAEVCFASEAEAQAAGYRAPQD